MTTQKGRVARCWRFFAGTVTVCVILSALAFFVGLPHAWAQQRSSAYTISAIQARLFYENKGAFSGDVLADKNFALWNVVIGEGSAEGPSNATLVLVEVSGSAGAYEPMRKVEFVATIRRSRRGLSSAKDVLVRRTLGTGILNAKGKWYAAFWLYGTGCEPISLSARIAGQARQASLQRTIDFRCGE